MLDSIKAKDIALHTAKPGVNILSTDNLSVAFLAPIGNSSSYLNSYPAFCKMQPQEDMSLAVNAIHIERNF